MERNEFDQMLRNRLEGVIEPAPDVWEGISRGLARRHRRVILRRFATGAVAAAAGLAVAFLVFRGPQATRQVTAPIRTARAVQPVLPQETQDAPVPEVAPIATQIAQFTKHQVTAQASVPKPVVPETTQDIPVQPSTVPTEPAVPVTPQEETTPVTPVSEGPQLTQDDLPADLQVVLDFLAERRM